MKLPILVTAVLGVLALAAPQGILMVRLSLHSLPISIPRAVLMATICDSTNDGIFSSADAITNSETTSQFDISKPHAYTPQPPKTLAQTPKQKMNKSTSSTRSRGTPP